MSELLTHEKPVMIEWRCVNKHKHVEIVSYVVGAMLAHQHRNMRVFEIDPELLPEARQVIA